MSQTYRAILVDDHLQWQDAKPLGDKPLQVQITIIEPASNPTLPNGKAVAAALQKLADMGGIRSIPDPVAWQREMRIDRPLPGREE